jgi:large subunit ribosomal protein L28
MSARCSITKKGLQIGHKVSHSNIKTKRSFNVNLQKCSLYSESLKQTVSLKIAVSTLRTIEHNGGLDEYLTTTSNRKLSSEAISLKKKILKAKEGSQTA